MHEIVAHLTRGCDRMQRARPLRTSALFILLFSTSAAAQLDPVSLNQLRGQAGSAEEPSRFAGSTVSLSSEMGLGTFVTDYSANPYVATGLSLMPRFRLTPQQSLAATWGFSFEHTLPDNDEGRRYSPGDLGVQWLYSGLIREPVTGLGLSTSAGLSFPTSYESRFNGTVVNANAGLNIGRGFFGGKLTTALSGRFTKFFPLTASRGLHPGDAHVESDRNAPGSSPALPSVFCREGASICSGGTLNANFALSTGLSVGFSFTDALTLSGQFVLAQTTAFAVPEELSDPNLPRAGRRVITRGGVNLYYQATDRIGLSFGFDSAQPALSSDNKALRFPLYDFATPSNNNTVWTLSVQASL
jgi:hypothetical protein